MKLREVQRFHQQQQTMKSEPSDSKFSVLLIRPQYLPRYHTRHIPRKLRAILICQLDHENSGIFMLGITLEILQSNLANNVRVSLITLLRPCSDDRLCALKGCLCASPITGPEVSPVTRLTSHFLVHCHHLGLALALGSNPGHVSLFLRLSYLSLDI